MSHSGGVGPLKSEKQKLTVAVHAAFFKLDTIFFMHAGGKHTPHQNRCQEVVFPSAFHWNARNVT